MKYHKKLSLSKTKGEWDIIEKLISQSDQTDLTNFLRSKIKDLITEFSKCPKCVTKAKGNTIEKRPYIHIDQFNSLMPISKKMNIHISEVIDQLIIQPLLK